ncbi:MAG: amidase [Hyphomicrobiales bacterium]|nr:amidase [Hyphomicrobiales bacterium]
MELVQNFGDFDALGLAGLVRRREVSPSELLATAIARLDAVEPRINAMAMRHDDLARGDIARGLPDGPFAGVPFLLKDITMLAGTMVTYGSRAFADNVADHSSTLVERYKAAGLVIFGKTSTPELGLNITTEPRFGGPACNPWNLAHSTGGSSGGSAAAVAARVIPLAHATDGGGSIRIPAACCGLFGMKPTRGRMPMGPGVLEGWAGMSTGHCLSLSVRDSAALLDATHGPEPGSPVRIAPPERPFLEEVGRDVGRLRIGFCTRHPAGLATDPEIVKAVSELALWLDRQGHEVSDVMPGFVGKAGDAQLKIIAANVEVALRSREARLGRPLGPDDLEIVTMAIRAMAGHVSASDYINAVTTMHLFGRQAELFFDDFDVLMVPTLSLPPLERGRLDMMSKDVSAYMKLSGHYAPWTAMFNMSGQPAMSMPLATSKAGLPLGVMFAARAGAEGTLYRLAAMLEREKPWIGRKPPVCA